MEATITKWGNSLAIRIPITIAQDLKVNEGSKVELKMKEGKLIIERPHYSLEELLSLITPENLHGEIDTGDFVGKEEW
jgi:antitoxin MazE